MSTAEWNKLMAKTMSEEALLVEVLDLCVRLRLAHIHFDTAIAKSGQWMTAQRGTRGFPDLVAVGSVAVMFAELKDERNTTSPGQKVWGKALASLEEVSGGSVRYRLWRPRHLLDGTIERELGDLQ